VNWIAADIVRIQHGILIEHWDVIQTKPLRNSRRVKPQCSVTDLRDIDINAADLNSTELVATNALAALAPLVSAIGTDS